MVLWLILAPVGALVGYLVGYFYKTQLWNTFLIVRYELLYWGLGVLAVGDDMVWGWKNKLKEKPKRTGDIAVVTGGSRGIGRDVVKTLLECDMTVVIACRNVAAGQSAIDGLRKDGITSGKGDVLPLDTASQASVKKFVELFLKKYDRLNLLVNNAGIMFVPFKLTEDGFESQLAVNYLGHFTLTQLLLPALAKAGAESGRNGRVVNVSSCAHLPGSINYEDINYERTLYIPSQAYAQSKLAQIMFAKAVDRRVRQKGLPVSIYSIHPGVVNTELFNGTLLKRIAPWMPALFFKRPDQGAVTILYAALSPEVEQRSGAYLANCREAILSGTAKSQDEQEKLMTHTLKMLKISDFMTK